MKRFFSVFIALLLLFGTLPVYSLSAKGAFTGADKVTIVIDPGHGGSNIGASARGVGEKTFTFRLASLLKSELEANGSFNVYLTRSGDYDLELYERAEVANNYNADLLLSLHFDGNPSSSVNGVTTYTSIFDAYASVSLAKSIAQNISASTGLANNGVRRRADSEGYFWNSEKQWDCQDSSLGILSDYYGIPTWAAKFGMRSIIVEHGYFSNPRDVGILFTDGTLEKIAAAEASAIIAHYTNHTHVYSAATRDFPSNCVYTGKQSEHCSVCGHRRNVSLLAPAPDNHYWVTKSYTAPSCGVDGKTVRECRITQNLADKGWTGSIHAETLTVPAPTQHTMEMIKNVSPTHTVDGYQTFKCKTCSYSFTETVKAEGHTLEYTGYKSPTCTEDGGDTYKCTKCSHTYMDTVPATGHSFEIISKTDPTCTNRGQTDKKCSVCAFEETVFSDPLGHSLPEGAVTPPTCTENGSRKGDCMRCGQHIDETLEKTGHTMTVTQDVPPSCETDGKKTSLCSVCGYKEETIAKAKGHSFERTVTLEATCEKDGSATLVCSACGHTEEENIKALGHKKGEKPVSKTESGLFSAKIAEYECENGCGKIFKEEIPSVLSSKGILILIALGTFITAASIGAVIFIIIINKQKKAEPESEDGEADAGETESKNKEKADAEESESKEAEEITE